MSTITITLPDDRLAKLKDISARFNVPIEDLVRVSINELLALPDAAFQQAVSHVLTKNRELYRRLA